MPRLGCARGKGFPNLTGTVFLFGRDPETIETTITNGRNGQMPPMAAALGSEQDVENVANYVLSLSGWHRRSGQGGTGQAQVRQLRAVPRCRRQRQSGIGCACTGQQGT